jgi:hypothetical protein
MVIESLFYKIREPYRIIIYDLEGSVIYSGVKDKIRNKTYYTIEHNVDHNISKGINTFGNIYLKITIDIKTSNRPISISISFNDLKYVMDDENIEIIENDNILYSGNIDGINYEEYKNYIVYSITPYENIIKIVVKYTGAYNTP